MNTKVVKSFGLALIVAVGVLALLLATGTFSPQKAGAQETDLVHGGSISVTPNDPGPGATGAFTVTFRAEAAIGGFERLAVELEGFGVPSSIERTAVQIRTFGVDTERGDTVGAIGFADDVSVSGNTITLEIYASTADNTPDDIEIPLNTWVDLVFRQRAGLTAPAEAGDYAVSVAEETNEEAVTVSRSLSVDPTKGGSATEITVSGKAFANGTASLYTVTLVSPDGNGDGIIDTLTQIAGATVGDGADDFTDDQFELDVDGDGDANYFVFANDDDSAYIITPLVFGENDDPVTETNAATHADATLVSYTIIGRPQDALDRPANDPDTGDADEASMAELPSLMYKTADAKLLKDVTVSDGAFSTTILAEDLDFGGSQNMSYVRIIDANGDDDYARFQVTGTTSLGSDSVGKGKLLKISLSDWIGDLPDEVKIGGETVAVPGVVDDAATEDKDESVASGFLDEDGDPLTTSTNPTGMLMDSMFNDDGVLNFYVKVSGEVGLGTKSVVLFSDGDPLAGARDSVGITAVDLTVSPSTALVGREVTVTGSGFTGNVKEIKVGKATICDSVTDCNIQVASGGRVVAAFNIPNEEVLKDADDYTITITDTGGRVGNGSVTIPEPTLTVDPLESRIGSTINLSGTGWPTGTGANLVGLYYDTVQYASAITDSSGEWSASIEVPHEVDVGSTHDVEAKATVGGASAEDNNVTQKAKHSTPDAVVTLSSATAQRGTSVTVSGENFNVFETVMIEIGDSNATPAGTTTDGVGSFSADVLVPGLALGNKNLKVTVKGVPVVEFLEIVATAPAPTEPASTDPADVFASLIEDGVLVEFWGYNNDAGEWQVFNPSLSEGESMALETAGVLMTSTSSIEAGWLNLSEDATFQGKDRSAGWSLIPLN